MALKWDVALLVYDYMLTFELEISEIWSREFHLSSFLFLLVRYGSILSVAAQYFLSENDPQPLYVGESCLLPPLILTFILSLQVWVSLSQ